MILTTRATPRPQTIAKSLVVMVVTGLALWVLSGQLTQLDGELVQAALWQMGPASWLFALMATVASFWSLGRYDSTAHYLIGTGVVPAAARRAGMAGIAIGQTVGLSSVTSAFVRWRMLPEAGAVKVAKVSAFVALSFSTCWAIFAVIALVFAAEAAGFAALNPVWTGVMVVVIAIFGVRVAKTYGFHWATGLRLLGWTALDIGFACLTLYVLLPDSLGIRFPELLLVYTLALGAGILSNAPGGIGVFEIVLLALLPVAPSEDLVASVLAYRIVYYVLPFCWGLQVMLSPRAMSGARRLDPDRAEAILLGKAPAAWGLARQSGDIRGDHSQHWHVLPLPFAQIALHDPLGPRKLNLLQADAAINGRLTALYHASPRMAVAARKQGWRVMRIAERAEIDVQTWRLEGRAFQGLRRKLKQAQAAGVTATLCNTVPSADVLDPIAQEWSDHHGGEMGATMGTYDPVYVAQQKIVLIVQHGNPIGFVTFHRGIDDWALDLMRYKADLPAGAMHAAIVAAIEAAKARGAQRLCLAAVPVSNGILGQACKCRRGLIQFKQGFRPRWIPQFYCAPHWPAMVLTVTILTLAIHQPWRRLGKRAHNQDEKNEFALSRARAQ